MGPLQAPQAAVLYLRGTSRHSMSQLQTCLKARHEGKAARPRVPGRLLGPVQGRQYHCPHLVLPEMAAEVPVPVIQSTGQLGRRGSRSEAAAVVWFLYTRNWMEIRGQC